MMIVVVLIAISLTVAAGFLVAFLWSLSAGQYEDVDGPAMRMLMDDNTGLAGKVDAPLENVKFPDKNHTPA
jgi:cbb3-type cytochrome oxidase maturation protein